VTTRAKVAFCPGLTDDAPTNRNFRDLAEVVRQLQEQIAAAAAVSTPSRVFLGEKTGVGPWSFTGLAGDTAGLRGYELVFRVTKAAVALHTLALRFNNDTAANYTDSTSSATTEARLTPTQMYGSGETTEGVVLIPFAKSGSARNVVGQIQTVENSPTTFPNVPDSAWVGTAAITQIDVINLTGTVDAGTFALYALMDVAA